jgi:hypothetical protein
LNKFLTSIENKAKQVGGYSKLPTSVLNEQNNLFGLYIKFQNSIECSKYDEATKYYNQISEIVSAGGCNCGCSDNDEPSPFVPISQVNNTVVVQGGTGITVTSVTVGTTTTYTVTLSNGYQTIITNLQSEVTTLQGDVTTLQSNVSTLQTNVTNLQALVPVLLHSDTTVSGTANTSGDQVLKTYSLQAGTLGVDGDIIEVELLAFKNGDQNNQLFLEFGGQQVFSARVFSSSIINLTAVITRISSASQKTFTKGSIGANPNNIIVTVQSTNEVIARVNRTVNLDNAQNIDFRVVKTSGNFTLSEVQAQLLTIIHYKK